MPLSQKHILYDFKQLNLHRQIYLAGLCLLALGLPLSPFLVSSAQFILGLNWLNERKFKQKAQRLAQNRILWALFMLPLVHLIWLINTSDFSYAIHDLKIKIPLLIFPLILGTSKPLSQKELSWILSVFIFAVFSGTVSSLGAILGIYPIEINDYRDISLFVSHIRFGLMILLAILILANGFISKYNQTPLKIKLATIALTLWMLYFLVILQSVTSWLAILLIMVLFFAKNHKKIKKRALRLSLAFILITVFLSGSALIMKVYHDFYHTKTFDLNNLPTHTHYGNKYKNNISSALKENGHYINILICDKELKETWPKISRVPYSGKDAKGYSIRNTLTRYLASKGLTKDRDGLLSLEPEDISMIENGFASCVYRTKFVPYSKIYSIIWEIDRYKKSHNANNKSIVQRIEFSKMAIHIIKQNFWVGVGTGDIAQAFTDTYARFNPGLTKKNRLRAHNQFLTFFAAFGVLGFLIALYSMFYPALNIKNDKLYVWGFFLMVFISMLNEDTLETQAGATFYAFFYTLFVFSKQPYND